MTGRRLYDLICDGWHAQGGWGRTRDYNVLLPPTPVAWPFLSGYEQKALSQAAARISKVRRVAK